MLRNFSIPVVIFVLLILGGAYFYNQVEGWNYLDSVYFTVVTATTIGYGDIAPKTDTGKIFTIFFTFVGIGLAFYFFSLIGRYIFMKQLRERLIEDGRLKGKIGIKRIKSR